MLHPCRQAYAPVMLNAAKIGILVASVVSASAGLLMLRTSVYTKSAA
jgi:Na+/H+ antiporter NhaA